MNEQREAICGPCALVPGISEEAGAFRVVNGFVYKMVGFNQCDGKGDGSVVLRPTEVVLMISSLDPMACSREGSERAMISIRSRGPFKSSRSISFESCSFMG